MRTNLKIGLIVAAAISMLSALNVHAFALLGPFQSWMTNGFYPSNSGDIGGPMCISNEYRWNVPVVTYGFDQSFLNFFGTNGVSAVQNAIQMLNALPPASQIVLNDYPFKSTRVNYAAEQQFLYDLKSETLQSLLEQMGLAQPTRFLYVLRRWNPIFVTSGFAEYNGYVFPQTNWVDGIVPNNISERNYDPATLMPSDYVNGTFYDGVVLTMYDGNSIIEIYSADPSKPTYTAVADQSLYNGQLYLALTYDDVGGLSYLLSTNNVNYETLLPGVVGVGTNVGSLINGAWRPGVDKITFIPHSVDSQSGAFITMTNFFTDSYITNGILMQQQVARIIPQPDFLFSASNVLANVPPIPFYCRTGTTNWLNNAALNGNPNGGGPGVIQPPIQIVFNKLGRLFYVGNSEEQVDDESSLWSSFDSTTNAPVTYPVTQTGTNQMTVRLWLGPANGSNWQFFDWKPVSASGTQYAVQTSTNLSAWVTLFNVTNNNTITSYINNTPRSASRFYRMVQQ